MISIHNVKASNVVEAVVAFGNAYIGLDTFEYTTERFDQCLKFIERQPKDKRHDMDLEFLKNIHIAFDLTIPVYMIPEVAQYGIVTFGGNGFVSAIVNSIANGLQNDNLPKDTRDAIIKTAQELKYAKRVRTETDNGDEYIQKTFSALMGMIPMSVEVTFRVSTNYHELKRLFHNSHYSSLKNEWRALRDTICTFPYAQNLIGARFD